MQRRVAVLLLTVYAMAVAVVAIFPADPGPGFAALPWWVMIHYIPFRVDATSFMLNIVMFMPFGVLVPLVWPRAGAPRRLLGLALAVSVGIELIQLVMDITLGSRRTVDINDPISNVAGAAFGLALLRLAAPARVTGAGVETSRSR